MRRLKPDTAMRTWPPSIAWPKGRPRNCLPRGQELLRLAGCRPNRAVDKTQRPNSVALGNMARKNKRPLPPPTGSARLLKYIDVRRLCGQRLGHQLELWSIDPRNGIGCMTFEEGVD